MQNDFLKKYSFDPAEFARLQEYYRTGKLSLKTNVITWGNRWEVGLARPKDTVAVPGEGSGEFRRGRAAIAEGSFGLILMNGGAATRFQQPGGNLPKGAFEIMEANGRPRSFMELKLSHARWAEKEFGGSIPAWILNSYFTDDRTREILKQNDCFGKNLVFTYCQGIMLRVVPTPDDLQAHYGKALHRLVKIISSLPPGKERTEKEEEKRALEDNLKRWMEESRHRAGEVIEAEKEEDRCNPPGHLDTTLFLVLDKGRPLLRMLELGVEFLMIANIDNLGATVWPGILGLLELRRARGVGILCEVSKKPPGQKGGALARLCDRETGREWTQLIEEFAFPPGFDQDRIPDFNNATYTIAVSTLLELFGLDRRQLESLGQEALTAKVKGVTDRLPVYVAIKELKGREGGGESVRPVVQFERLQGDLTRLLKPLAVRTVDRFFPVKSREDIPMVVPELRRILKGKLLLD